MTRLSAEERKTTILDAALPLFAERGFHGVSTKELAKSAGISEALLFKHFSNKEDLYDALRDRCCAVTEAAPALAALPPSTAALCASLYFLVRGVALGSGVTPSRHELLTRLVTTSLLEDGRFARDFLKARIEPYLPHLTSFWSAAKKAGDLVQDAPSPQSGVWFTQHMALVLALGLRGDEPLASYAAPERLALCHDMTCFALRGLGVTPYALKRHAERKSLEAGFERLIGAAGSAGG